MSPRALRILLLRGQRVVFDLRHLTQVREVSMMFLLLLLPLLRRSFEIHSIQTVLPMIPISQWIRLRLATGQIGSLVSLETIGRGLCPMTRTIKAKPSKSSLLIRGALRGRFLSAGLSLAISPTVGVDPMLTPLERSFLLYAEVV